MPNNQLIHLLQKNLPYFGRIVAFNSSKQKLLALDLSTQNKDLTDSKVNNQQSLASYINQKLNAADASFGIGGYLENRQVYENSNLFNGLPNKSEPRTVHLGVDIWAAAGTTVFAPLAGIVHSFAYNNKDGDYGATIILQHQLEGFVFHTLYGHLSLADLAGLRQNGFISTGMPLAHFGTPAENGNWPPHLHFQIILDMQLNQGDYPGVCAASKQVFYQNNCPNPDLILQMDTHKVIQ